MSTLAPHLAAQITVAEPTVVGPLAVFPLIADRSPSVRYVSFAEAVQRGATVKELGGGASVNDLVVHNPLDVPVLLYEGEEVLGAQQNRTFDVSVLVAATSLLQVPVSCVEAGRWDGGRHDEAFAPAPQTANPRLRRMKNTQARASLAAGLEARAVQCEVWREVAETADRHGVNSPHRRHARRVRTPARAARHCRSERSRCTAARSGCSPRSAAASSYWITSARSRRSPRFTARSFRGTRSTRSKRRTRHRPSSTTRGTSSSCSWRSLHARTGGRPR